MNTAAPPVAARDAASPWSEAGSIGHPVWQRLQRPGVVSTQTALGLAGPLSRIAERHADFAESLTVRLPGAEPGDAGARHDDSKVWRRAAPRGIVIDRDDSGRGSAPRAVATAGSSIAVGGDALARPAQVLELATIGRGEAPGSQGAPLSPAANGLPMAPGLGERSAAPGSNGVAAPMTAALALATPSMPLVRAPAAAVLRVAAEDGAAAPVEMTSQVAGAEPAAAVLRDLAGGTSPRRDEPIAVLRAPGGLPIDRRPAPAAGPAGTDGAASPTAPDRAVIASAVGLVAAPVLTPVLPTAPTAAGLVSARTAAAGSVPALPVDGRPSGTTEGGPRDRTDTPMPMPMPTVPSTPMPLARSALVPSTEITANEASAPAHPGAQPFAPDAAPPAIVRAVAATTVGPPTATSSSTPPGQVAPAAIAAGAAPANPSPLTLARRPALAVHLSPTSAPAGATAFVAMGRAVLPASAPADEPLPLAPPRRSVAPDALPTDPSPASFVLAPRSQADPGTRVHLPLVLPKPADVSARADAAAAGPPGFEAPSAGDRSTLPLAGTERHGPMPVAAATPFSSAVDRSAAPVVAAGNRVQRRQASTVLVPARPRNGEAPPHPSRQPSGALAGSSSDALSRGAGPVAGETSQVDLSGVEGGPAGDDRPALRFGAPVRPGVDRVAAPSPRPGTSPAGAGETAPGPGAWLHRRARLGAAPTDPAADPVPAFPLAMPARFDAAAPTAIDRIAAPLAEPRPPYELPGAPPPPPVASRAPTAAPPARDAEAEVEALVERAWQTLMSRLAIEHERRGYGRWA